MEPNTPSSVLMEKSGFAADSSKRPWLCASGRLVFGGCCVTGQGSENVGMWQGAHGSPPAGLERGALANAAGEAAGPQPCPAWLEPGHLPRAAGWQQHSSSILLCCRAGWLPAADAATAPTVNAGFFPRSPWHRFAGVRGDGGSDLSPPGVSPSPWDVGVSLRAWVGGPSASAHAVPGRALACMGTGGLHSAVPF